MWRATSALLLAVLLVSCTSPAGDDRARRVMLVAVDGMEWDVVLPLLHEGRLPHIAAAMQRGSFGLLESTLPTASPIIWTTVATGKPAVEHGIEGFVHGDRAAPERLYTNLDRKTKAIWNIATDEGRRSAVIGWWMTFPVEAIDGVMVAQTNTLPDESEDAERFWKGVLYEGVPGQVHPPELQQELFALVAEAETALPELARQIFGSEPDPAFDPVAARLWQACRWALRADEIYRRAALALLAREEPFDLFAVYFGGPDVLGHRFWRYLHPEQFRVPPTAEQVRAYGRLIPAYYEHVDRILGDLLAAAPPDTNLLLLSDHGMAPTRRDMAFAPELPVLALRSGGHKHAPPGVLVAAGPDIEPAAVDKPPERLERADLATVGSVLDIAPTLLAMLRMPLAHDMPGKVLAQVTSARAERWVDSHTPEGWFDARTREVETPMSEERLEQLRSLGYIGGGEGE